MNQTSSGESLKALLNEHFGDIDDPRMERTRAHQLLDIIAITLLALLSGADGWVNIETYGKAKQDWLASFLELPNGIPSHDTFARVLTRLDPEALESRFQQWIQLVVSKLEGEVVAIDGKTLRGSYDREKGVKALALVSAWASEHRLVLGQCAVETDSNEITAIPLLLEQLELTGAIVSIDAIGTQVNIARQIRCAQAEYILALKGNQPQLFEAASNWFESHAQHESSLHPSALYRTDCEAGHGRIERRSLWQVPAETVFEPQMLKRWESLRTLVVVERVSQSGRQQTRALRFFLSSLEADAESFASYIRDHWGIENQLHWCLDVTFEEDASRIRTGHGAKNMSVLKRMCLNLLRQENSKMSLKMKRYRAAMDNSFLLKVFHDFNSTQLANN